VERLPAPALPPFLARALPFERYVVEVLGERLHVVEVGAGPAVVLLHGNPTWSYLWRKVAVALERTPLRLVMPDLVGLGLSSKPRAARFHTLERHAQLVGALLDGIAPGPLVLVVHDWGGPIGLAALADRPGRLAGLVVTNTRLGPPRAERQPTPFHRFANLPVVSDVAFRLLGFPQNVLGRTQADRASISGEVARGYTWPLRRIADRAAPLALARMVPRDLHHPSIAGLVRGHALATSFPGPTAIVWGEADPIIGRALRSMQDTLPRAAVTRVPAGHYPQEETPGPIADAIRAVAREAGLLACP
jgi:haloalkane dehalogenase